MSSVISHQLFKSPDWLALKIMEPEAAHDNLRAILAAYDGAEKQVFAVRGMAALLIEERELYRFDWDDEVGDYFKSFDRWLKTACPNSWSYVRDALRAVKELKDVKFSDLLEIKRCNLEHLKQVSSNVRTLPEVVLAAKILPEKQFVQKLNQEHDQHLEAKSPVVMASPGVSGILEQAIEMAMALEGCKSREQALEAIAAYFVTGCQGSYEKYLQEHLSERTA